MKTSEIRQRFIDYFVDHQHQALPSSSLVPHNDPSLLFTNAGMVQFKEVFLGMTERPCHRAVTAQRCLRAGGKHNDLENVGYTARHHTLFEMLGNFSFGDYFKRQAIRYAWSFLTVELGLPAEKLWVTVYEEDQEAEKIWLDEVGVDAQRFSRCGEADNFWSMGDTGPCGPCSEIFYDHGPDVAGGPPGSPEQEGDRYVEIWNMVFMQFNRLADGTVEPLPKTAVDTGMGIERIAAVLQGVHSNYETDVFQAIIAKIRHLVPGKKHAWNSLCVIADHIRASSFLIADGILPGPDGRAYVLRRIIRRAVRHGHQIGIESPFLHQLVAVLVEAMGDFYTELKHQQVLIERTLKHEEQQFAQTLDRGLKLMDEALQELQEDKVLPGEVVFKLYDTYGFPVDLTADIARQHNKQLDLVGFEQCMSEQRQRSGAKQSFASKSGFVVGEVKTDFTGYQHTESEAKVMALFADGQKCDDMTKEQQAKSMVVLLNQTPFYAESGGQAGDSGMLRWSGGEAQVCDTQKQGNVVLHHVVLLSGSLAVGQEVVAAVDSRRGDICRHHSATHLLHAALRQILGSGVEQKGSLVTHDRLRFDFSYDRPVSDEHKAQIESLVNQWIRANVAVQTEHLSLPEAQQRGAMMLFGEKYADEVRVLTMGQFSVELCGGTHVARTGDIGYFIIIEEQGVAAGIRRIEALVGQAAHDYVSQRMALLSNMARAAQTSVAALPEKVHSLQQSLSAERAKNQKSAQMILLQAIPEMVSSSHEVAGLRVLVRVVAAARDQLREMADRLRDHQIDVVVLVGKDGDQLPLLVAVQKQKSTDLSAHLLLRCITQKFGGKGGGRPDMAQGGLAQSTEEAIIFAEAKRFIEEQQEMAK